MNIYLIGYRGTGKSSVAPILAEKLGSPWQALEMDAEIEKRAGRSIAQIFEQESEKGFRTRESSLLAEWGACDHLVVSTGGGVILAEANRTILQNGFVVWLEAPAEVIDDRLRSDQAHRQQRPSLTSLGARAEIESMLAHRTPFYRSLAHLTLSSVDHSPAELADRIAQNLKDRGNA